MPPPVVFITEIGPQSTQGMTAPRLCCADEGRYFVKTIGGAGPRSLVCEWLAGRLAQRLGLPIAPFAVAYLDEALVRACRAQTPHAYDLTAGEAFASLRTALAGDIPQSNLADCPEAFRRDLVAFDWWIRNADRTLSQGSGNPNLLWTNQTPPRPVVIDHNLAFDPDFCGQTFTETHLFRADFATICDDLVLRAQYQQQFAELLPAFPAIWAELPDNWTHDEAGQARFQAADFEQVLRRAERDDFWCVEPRALSSSPQP